MESHSRKRRADSPPTDPPPTDPPPTVLPTPETLAVIRKKRSDLEAENIRDNKRKGDAPLDTQESTPAPPLQTLDVSENKGAKIPTLPGMVRAKKMREFTVKVKKRKRDASSDAGEPTLGPQTKNLKALDKKEKSTARAPEFRPLNEPPSRFILPEVSNPDRSALGGNPTEPRMVFKLGHFFVIACTRDRDAVARLIDMRANVDSGFRFQFLTHQVNECFYMHPDAESAWYPRSAVKRRLIPEALRTDSQGILRVGFDFQVLLQYNVLP